MHGTSAGVPVTLSSYGGLVTLAKPETLPEGASPRTYDTDYDVGSVRTRDGLTNVYAVSDAAVGPNSPSAANSSTWNNPNNILADDGSYTTITPVNVVNSIAVTEFVFDVPSTSTPAGVLARVTGFANAPCNLMAQLLVGGALVGNVKTISLPQTPSTFPFGSLTDLWGTFLTYAQVNGLSFGIQFSAISVGFDLATVSLDFVSVELGVSTGTSNFDYIGTYPFQDGSVRNIALDANGNLYVENVTTNPGVLALVLEGITPNSYCVGVSGSDVAYLAISNGFSGSDQPLQYTPNWIDRITQVGPGAAPTFSPVSASSNVYDIATITQPPQQSYSHAYFLRSTGPGSPTPGSVITAYYSDKTVGGVEDSDLATAFASGMPVYLYVYFTSPVANYGPYTIQVTSLGLASPNGQPHTFYYFTFNDPTDTVAYTLISGSSDPTATWTYQRTESTMAMTQPVPGLEVGNKVTITGASETPYNTQWTIAATPNSGQYVITSTQVTSGVATYGYAYSGGTSSPPATGQLVTITNTTGANGQLNFANATIASGGTGSTGTFTINVSLPDSAATTEDGLATTAGTVFNFDPGSTVAYTADPIYGTSTDGSFTFGANAQFIANGTRQGTVFFITRNGYYTAPAPPVTFTTPTNTTSISVSNIPIGPPSVVARGIAITEAGQNGVPGANFFTLPQQVQVIVNDVIQTSTSLFVMDNVSTSASVAFSDSVLLNGLAIGEYGYNLFNQIEIGDPGWISSYNTRNAYGLCWNKIQNFNNLSFDGGYLPGARLVPLGWTINDAYGYLTVSPKFGNAWYVMNSTGSTLASAGSISQTAYQSQTTNPPGTTNGTPIINANTTYSVRVTARIPSGLTNGNLVITLTNLTNVLGTYTLPFSSMTTSDQIFTGTLLTTALATVPSGLMLNVSTTELGAGADVEIDRIEVYPTEIPILTTTVYFSYAGLFEQVDSVTGAVVFASENQEPVYGGLVLYDTFYGLKSWAGKAPGASMYSLQASGNLEPAQWEEPEVAQKSGGIGILAFDSGKQWVVMANRPGLDLFVGGQPGKINQEIIQVWNALNWTAAQSIWVRVDETNRRLYVGVPIATPNFWLPNAAVNANPTTPNVILMCNYQGLDTGEELKASPQMHTTMFGSLNAVDMRRKWSIWQIPSPFANICQGLNDQQFYICNGRGDSKIYSLDADAVTDDGIIIDSLYTTAGLVAATKRAETPGVGNFRLRWGAMVAAMASGGTVAVRLLANRLFYPEPNGYNPWTLPGGFAPTTTPLNDVEASLNFAATRTFFEFRENDGYGFTLSNLVLHVKKDVWNAWRGAK